MPGTPSRPTTTTPKRSGTAASNASKKSARSTSPSASPAKAKLENVVENAAPTEQSVKPAVNVAEAAGNGNSLPQTIAETKQRTGTAASKMSTKSSSPKAKVDLKPPASVNAAETAYGGNLPRAVPETMGPSATTSAVVLPVLEYPPTRRDESVKESFFDGKYQVEDPYRWLEDPDSKETTTFVEAQNKITNDFLAMYPHRSDFHEKLTEAYNFERFGCPFRRGDCYFYFHNSGLQAQSVLYRQTSLDGEAAVFFDPNTLSADGTSALSTYAFSDSGSHFAYGISNSGSDWVTIHVMDAKTLEKKDDLVEWVKFSSISWTKDERGFFYSQYPKPADVKDAGTETSANTNGMLFYHRLGQKQEEDVLIFKDPANPTNMFGAEVSDDGKYLIMTISESCDPVNKLYIADLTKYSNGLTGTPEFTKVVDNFEAEYSYITNEDSVFYFKSNAKAPRYKIVKYDMKKPAQGFVDVVKETKNVLQFASCIHQKNLVTAYLKDVKHVVQIRELASGKVKKDLPIDIGSVDSMTGRKEDTSMFFKLSSFLNPGVIFRYDFTSEKQSVFRGTKLNIPGFRAEDYTTKQVFYESKDGTKIPMFIVSKKDVKLDGGNVTFLYGYGGFNISLTPMFSPAWVTFIRHMNGVVAVANIRGGGEYGEEWHKGGSIAQKQNCFDDFQAAAKYLISQGYTSSSKLAINGGSNGGLLVGACVNQAPDLFGCAIADVGVMDMLRFHKFTIGHAWKSDYGDPDKQEHFEVVRKYSPVHTVNSNPYPAVMLLTSDHDDRVVPLHSYKYIAALQHAHPKNPKPLVIRIETKAGHGAGKPTSKRIEEATDRFAFVALTLGAPWVN